MYPAHISLHVCVDKVIIDNFQIDYFSSFVKVSKATIANSFKSICVYATKIGRCNTNRCEKMLPEGKQKEDLIYDVAELQLISAWVFGRDLAGGGVCIYQPRFCH